MVIGVWMFLGCDGEGIMYIVCVVGGMIAVWWLLLGMFISLRSWCV